MAASEETAQHALFAERLLGDEALRGAVPEKALRALLRWALAELQRVIPADATEADAEAAYAALRAALLAAARSGISAPKRLIALAAEGLGAGERGSRGAGGQGQ